MMFTRIRAIILRKEFIQIGRTRAMIAIIIGMPIIQLVVLVDAQNSNMAITGAAYVRQILLSWGISQKRHIWYNPEMKAVFYMVPGIIVLLVGFVELFIALLVARPVYHIPIAGSLPLFMGIVRELLLKGLELTELLPQILALAVLAVSVITGAMPRFNKRLG